MVAVGDEHRPGPQQSRHLRRHSLVDDRPHLARHTLVVGGLDRRLPCHGGVEQCLHLAGRIRIEAKHLAEIHPAGPHQEQPILLRPRHRLLVGMDVAGAESLQPHPGHHPAADKRLPLELKCLVVDVERRRGLLHEHALSLPLLEKPGGPGVPVQAVVVTGLLAVELQPHHVRRVTIVERGLQGVIDHVVGRRDHLRERADMLGVVAESTERGDGGHGSGVPETARAGRAAIVTKPHPARADPFPVKRNAGWCFRTTPRSCHVPPDSSQPGLCCTGRGRPMQDSQYR